MRVLHTIAEMSSACAELRTERDSASRSQEEPGARATLALVPTMGALHDGHLSLVRAARQQCDLVAVSIFVNPTQFGPNEDFSRYPRTWEADLALLQQESVDLLFAPGVNEMYAAGRNAGTYVEVPGISDRLDGRTRPGHFRGVATVVTKLFHIVMPDRVFFGQKDAAQIAVLRAMVRDLNFPVQLIACPTVRDSDGLALSSRNRYLSPQERETALALSRALRRAEEAAVGGMTDAHALRQILNDTMTVEPGLRIDYAEVVDPETLLPLDTVRDGALLAVAAWVGNTRLIDNVVLAASAERRSI